MPRGGNRRPLRGALRGVATAVGVLLAVAPAAGAQPVKVFVRVPYPGQPEGIVVARDGTVYVGTDAGPFGVRFEGTPPSKLFAFGPDGKLKREYEIGGQQRDGTTSYGLFGLALDGRDVVYAVDHNPPRIIALDPRSGAQRDYARFRDVSPCRGTAQADCSATSGDLAAFPNFAVFAADGTMYVTDIAQALIWRVPPGGGRPEVWLTDPRLESVFGPNGAQLEADGRTLMFVVSEPGPQAVPGLYTVEVMRDGHPGPLRRFWQAHSEDAPDGFQIGRSGKVYVTAGGTGQVVILSPRGEELARLPSPGDSSQEIPFDAPANVAFLGTRALVTNHAWVVYAPPHWAVLEFDAGEPGLPFFRPYSQAPSAPGTRAARIRLRASPARVRAGHRVRFHFTADVAAPNGRRRRVAGATIVFAGRSTRTDRGGRATLVMRLRLLGARSARAVKSGLLAGRAVVRVVSETGPRRAGEEGRGRRARLPM